eukprot:10724360-Alexandrium_andersonii.AAC.1
MVVVARGPLLPNGREALALGVLVAFLPPVRAGIGMPVRSLAQTIDQLGHPCGLATTLIRWQAHP